MNARQIGSATVAPSWLSPSERFWSNPTQTPTVMSGSKPTNQPSVKSSTVPVLPAIGQPSDRAL